jgi:hypothetical protein
MWLSMSAVVFSTAAAATTFLEPCALRTAHQTTKMDIFPEAAEEDGRRQLTANAAVKIEAYNALFFRVSWSLEE